MSTAPSQKQVDDCLDLYRRGRHAELQAQALALTERYPGFALGWQMLAYAWSARGEPGRALTAIRRASELAPSSPDVHYQTGGVQERLHRPAEARASYRRAIELGTHGWLAGALRQTLQSPGGENGQFTAEAVAFLLGADRGVAARVIAGAGFGMASPPAHNEKVLRAIVLPVLAGWLRSGHVDDALELHRAGMVACTIPQTQQRWASYFDRVNPLFIEAGERVRASLPAQAACPATGRLRVAFVLDAAVVGGSGFAMFKAILEDAALAPGRPLEIDVHALVPPPAELAAACSEWGFGLVDHTTAAEGGSSPSAMVSRLVDMRHRAMTAGASVAVLFSTYEGFACFAASIGLAPIQVYLTMGFHSLSSPRLDAYLACASFARETRIIRGRPWRTIPFPYRDPFAGLAEPRLRDIAREAQAARDRLLQDASVILGTLARAEKLDDDFLDALATIMRGEPAAIFLWFRHPSSAPGSFLERKLAERGILERCRCMGWVDTRVYAMVLDVHLDSFALPTGLTMNDTFWAGGAYVLRCGETSAHVALTATLSTLPAEMRAAFVDAQNGEDLLMLARTTEQYVAMARRLIGSPSLRTAVGNAAKAFMRRHFGVPGGTAMALEGHLREVIGSSLAAR